MRPHATHVHKYLNDGFYTGHADSMRRGCCLHRQAARDGRRKKHDCHGRPKRTLFESEKAMLRTNCIHTCKTQKWHGRRTQQHSVRAAPNSQCLHAFLQRADDETQVVRRFAGLLQDPPQA